MRRNTYLLFGGSGLSLSTLHRSTLALAVSSLAAAAAFWHPAPVMVQAAADPGSVAFYTEKVQPILQTNCYRCHAGMNHRGGLVIDTRAALLKGGHDGVVVVPGHADQSLLIKLIRHEGPADDPMPMPPREKMSDADIAVVTQWINAGAVMPPDPPMAP